MTALLLPSHPSPHQALGWGARRGRSSLRLKRKTSCWKDKKARAWCCPTRSSYGQHLSSKTFKLSICSSSTISVEQACSCQFQRKVKTYFRDTMLWGWDGPGQGGMGQSCRRWGPPCRLLWRQIPTHGHLPPGGIAAERSEMLLGSKCA